MAVSLISGTYHAENVNLADSEFHDVNLSSAKFKDVNLKDSLFDDVALTRCNMRNVSLIDVSIECADYRGMRIDGILVTELLRVFHEARPNDTQES